MEQAMKLRRSARLAAKSKDACAEVVKPDQPLNCTAIFFAFSVVLILCGCLSL